MRRWMRPLWAFVLIGMVVLGSAQASGQNLITNGTFIQVDAYNMPDHWATKMWHTVQGITEIRAVQDGDRGNVLEVHNFDDNDARAVQTIKVKTDTAYRITALVKASIEEEEGAGANLSVADVYVSSESLFDTGDTYQPLEFLGRTGHKQKDLEVWLRVGGFSSESKGWARFDDVVVEELSEEAAAAYSNLPSFEANKSQSGTGEAKGRNVLSHTIAQLILQGFLYALFASWIYTMLQTRKSPFLPLGCEICFVALLGLGLFIRFYLGMKSAGYENDMRCFTGWGDGILNNAPWNFYSAVGWCDYPPGYMLIMLPFRAIGQFFDMNDPETLRLFVKMPALIFDLATAVLIYQKAPKFGFSKPWATLLGAMVILNPGYIITSASWGQIDSVWMFFIVVAAFAVIEKKLMPASLAFTASLLIKPQALMLAPILLYPIISMLIEDPKNIRKVLSAILASVGLFFGVVLLFTGFKSPLWIIGKYVGTATSYPYATLNAFNFFALVGQNWAEDSASLIGPITNLHFGLFMLLLVIAGSLVLYLVKKKIKTVPLVAAVTVFGAYMFAMWMHERYFYPVIILLLVSYMILRDRRLFYLTIGATFTNTICTGMVLAMTHIMPDQPAPYLIMQICSLVNLILFGCLVWTSIDICVFDKIWKDRPWTSGEPLESEDHRFPTLMQPGSGGKLHMKRADWLVMIAITAVYSVVALYNLGGHEAPVTYWRSNAVNASALIDLGEIKPIERLYYYMNIGTGSFDVEVSEDGSSWQNIASIDHEDGNMFSWKMNNQFEPTQGRYVRIIAENIELSFMEVAVGNNSGERYKAVGAKQEGGREDLPDETKNLIDEFSTVPETPTYYNGMYFDEIYHGRTAYEHLNNMEWYETTHPPLGKVFISMGVAIFGMNPFGWRIAHTVSGILMVPAMYLLCKLLFKRRWLAVGGTLLMTFDFMHFAQTRIALIDGFGVLFILLMYFFMFKYMMQSYFHDGLKKTLITLLLCGICMGLGIASKWIDVYAGLGLAVLLFVTFAWRTREYIDARKTLEDPTIWRDSQAREFLEKVKSNFPRYMMITILWCVLVFLIIPGLIYAGSYFQYFQIPGKPHDIKGILDTIIKAQQSMFSYHSNLAEPHPFETPWFAWLLDIRPIWYYANGFLGATDNISTINSMGNPGVWWGCLVAVIVALISFVQGKGQTDKRLGIILIGLAAQYLPWTLISRATFIYHYFASVPFIILCAVWVCERLQIRYKSGKLILMTFTGICIVLFIMFYPILSGMIIPRFYGNLLKWLPSWQLFG